MLRCTHLESGLQENQRYADAELGALGFETLKYKTAALVFDGAATGISAGGLHDQHKVSEIRDLLGPEFRDASTCPISPQTWML